MLVPPEGLGDTALPNPPAGPLGAATAIPPLAPAEGLASWL